MIQREGEIRVQTDRFDGPLALLLHLVQKDDFKIQELDITKITEQYLRYLGKIKNLNFDEAGDYLYMASTLLYLKSKYSLDEEDKKLSFVQDEAEFPIQSPEELLKRLQELEHFQKMGQKIWTLPRDGEDTFTRPRLNRRKIINSMTAPMELSKLSESMVNFLIKSKRAYQVVRRDRVSIKEKLKSLVSVLQEGERTQFSKLVDVKKGIDEIVITFISLLELARLKKLSIYQREGAGEIYVEVLESLRDFDVEGANGFEPEQAL